MDLNDCLSVEWEFDRETDDPTQEEIREACVRIQATWSEDERLFRAGKRAYSELLAISSTEGGL